MKAKTILQLTIVISALLAQLTFAALPRYEIIDLGTLGGDWSIAYSVNDNGQIVGSARNSSDDLRATLFDPNGNDNNIDLGTLGSQRSEAYSINDMGQIVGGSDIESSYLSHATLFDPTGNQNNIDFGTLSGDLESVAYSINNSGQIVGWSGYFHTWDHATLFDPNGSGNNIELGTLGGSKSEALSINDIGQIVGWAETKCSTYPFCSTFFLATFFDTSGSGRNKSLGGLPGYKHSRAHSINNNGQIVGMAFNGGAYKISSTRAALFNIGSSNIDLGTVEGYSSRAHCINDKGQIVGSAGGRAVLFDPSGNGNNIDLNTLIDPNSGWSLEEALSINEQGWIVGRGYYRPIGDTHAFLLKPLPPIIIYVDDDAVGANDGSSWADAFNYLQDALTAAWSGDEIKVAQGTYKPDQGVGITPGDREATFQLINGVTIKGAYAGVGTQDPNSRDIELYETILSGDLAGDDSVPPWTNEKHDNSYHVVTGNATDASALLDGFTISGGFAYDLSNKVVHAGGMLNENGSPTLKVCTFKWNSALHDGGGMYNDNSNPTLINCTFSDNFAYNNNGGGMYNYKSNPTLINSVFSGNGAYWQGGGICNYQSNPTLRNCTFIANDVMDVGSGMCNTESSPTLTNCIFRENYAFWNGGGMYNDKSSPKLTNCTFSGNESYSAGGMCNWFSCPTLTNCIFSCNYVDTSCGGMYNGNSSPTLINCTFSGNTANSRGGGMYNDESSPNLKNCTFSDNYATYGGAMHNTNESDPILSHCTFKANTAVNYGGAIVNENHSAPILDYCTFVANTAHSGGGAIISEQENTLIIINNSIFAGNSARWGGAIVNDDCDQILTGCTFTGNIARIQNSGVIENDENQVLLTNCIFWSNLDMYGQITMNPFAGSADTMTVNYCCVQGWTGQYDGTGNIDDDPCFAGLGYWDANGTPEDANDDFWVDGNYHLLPDSLCIDAGDPNYIVGPNETDLDGRPRVIGDRIDMGAYEAPVFAEVRILPRTINLASKGKWITSYIWLPEGYDLADIEPSSVSLERQIKAERLSVDEDKQVATAIFDREKVQSILNVGDIELTIICQLTDGTYFEATDIIQVTDKGSGKSVN